VINSKLANSVGVEPLMAYGDGDMQLQLVSNSNVASTALMTAMLLVISLPDTMVYIQCFVCFVYVVVHLVCRASPSMH
jgi:hypothetical protein